MADTLQERLREASRLAERDAWSRHDIHDLGIGANLSDEAADALDAKDAEIARLTRIIEIQKSAMDRWVPCPDHRDKTPPGYCPVCAVEKAWNEAIEAAAFRMAALCKFAEASSIRQLKREDTP